MSLDPETLTIGFARRAATYKRATLLLSQPDRLRQIASTAGDMQIVYAGKAHPADEAGRALIRQIHQTAQEMDGRIKILYLPNYDMYLARLLVAGVDLWLNTPLPPMEASGTSGMRAALNGVINFSVRDGWRVEGHIEDVTGWRIGSHIQGSRKTTRRLTRPMQQTFTPNWKPKFCRAFIKTGTAG